MASQTVHPASVSKLSPSLTDSPLATTQTFFPLDEERMEQRPTWVLRVDSGFLGWGILRSWCQKPVTNSGLLAVNGMFPLWDLLAPSEGLGGREPVINSQRVGGNGLLEAMLSASHSVK